MTDQDGFGFFAADMFNIWFVKGEKTSTKKVDGDRLKAGGDEKSKGIESMLSKLLIMFFEWIVFFSINSLQ
jgi:hypothetical protein